MPCAMGCLPMRRLKLLSPLAFLIHTVCYWVGSFL